MPHPSYPGNELGRIGHEFYEASLRAKVETEANIGKIISIWSERIGYNAVYAVGGSLQRA